MDYNEYNKKYPNAYIKRKKFNDIVDSKYNDLNELLMTNVAVRSCFENSIRNDNTFEEFLVQALIEVHNEKVSLFNAFKDYICKL